MAQPAEADRPGNLILVPAVITLAVTLLRLVGELQQWSPRLFSRAAGGGFALVGISWLVPVFGIYFGIKLARAGLGPTRTAAGLGLLALAIAVVALAIVVALTTHLTQRRGVLLVCLGWAVAATIGWRAWSQLARTLFLYALAARIPVAILMLVAIYANWGTHYDVAPGFPPMSPFVKWLWIGLLPQMTFWVGYTIVIGGLFGLVAGAIAARSRRTAPGAVAA